MNHLFYGTTYDPEYEDLKTKAELLRLKKAGINVLRITGNAWRVWERTEGEYRLSTLIDTLELCQTNELDVIVSLPNTIPSWLERKDAGILRAPHQEGVPDQVDVMNPIYRHAFEWMCRKMLEVTVRYDCVKAYLLSTDSSLFHEWQKKLVKHYRKDAEFLAAHPYREHFQETADGMEDDALLRDIRPDKTPTYGIPVNSGDALCPPYPNQLLCSLLNRIARGDRGVEIGKIYANSEMYFEELTKAGRAISVLSPYLTLESVQCKTAIVVSATSLQEEEKEIRKWYRVLYEINLPFEVVDINDLPDRIASYRLLLVPALKRCSSETTRLLTAFVREGGAMIAGGRSFSEATSARGNFKQMPFGMTEVFGASYEIVTRPGQIKLLSESPVEYAELLTPMKDHQGVSYEHPYWNQYSGIVRNNYDGGRTVYLGCGLSLKALQNILPKEISDLLGELPYPDISYPNILYSISNRQKQQLHVLSRYDSGTVSLPCPFTDARDLLSDTTYRKGEEIVMEDWGIRILLEEASFD